MNSPGTFGQLVPDTIRPPKQDSDRRLQSRSKWELLHNVVASYGLYVSGYLLAFALVPYLVRVLGPAGWGLFAFTQTFGMYIIIVEECGFAFSATKLVAKHRADPSALGSILAGVWGAKAALTVLCLVVAVVASYLVPAFFEHPALFWSGVLWGVFQGANLNWYYQGLERMRAAATVDISLKAAAVLFSIGIVHGPNDGWKAFTLAGAACFVSLLILSFLAYREVPFERLKIETTVRFLRHGLGAFLPRNFFLISSIGGVFVLGLFAPPTIVGHYAGAERISRSVIGLLLPLTDALYSRINRIIAFSTVAFFRAARILLAMMTGCGIVIGMIVYVAAPYIVRGFLGTGYGPAVEILRVFAFISPLAALGNTLGVHWMLPLGLDRTFSYISAATTAVSLGFAVVLARSHQPLGVAWILLGTQLAVPLCCYFALRREGHDPLTPKGNLHRRA